MYVPHIHINDVYLTYSIVRIPQSSFLEVTKSQLCMWTTFSYPLIAGGHVLAVMNKAVINTVAFLH